MSSPVVNLPEGSALIIALIREDLRSYRFFDGLRELGLDDAWYQPELGTIILAQAGFNPESDHDLDRYYALLNKHADGLRAENKMLEEKARVMYEELLQPALLATTPL